jgi:hypothetical protein
MFVFVFRNATSQNSNWISVIPNNSIFQFQSPVDPVVVINEEMLSVYDMEYDSSINLNFAKQILNSSIYSEMDSLAISMGTSLDSLPDSLQNPLNGFKDVFLNMYDDANLVSFDTSITFNDTLLKESVLTFTYLVNSVSKLGFIKILIYENSLYLFSVSAPLSSILLATSVKDEFFNSITKSD